MKTKTLAFIIVFAALTIAINVAGPKIPSAIRSVLILSTLGNTHSHIVFSFRRNSRDCCIRDKHTHPNSLFSRRFASGTSIQPDSSPRNDDRRVYSIPNCNQRLQNRKPEHIPEKTHSGNNDYLPQR